MFLGDKSVLCEETHLFLSHLGFLDTLTILPRPLASWHGARSRSFSREFFFFFSTLRGGLDLKASGLTRLMIYIEEEMVTWGANYDYPSVFLVLHLVCSLHYQRKCRWWWWQKNHLDPLWWGWGLSWMHLSSGRTASFLGLFSNHLHTCLPPPPKTIFGGEHCVWKSPQISHSPRFSNQ